MKRIFIAAIFAVACGGLSVAEAQSKKKEPQVKSFQQRGPACTYSTCMAGQTKQCSRAGSDFRKRQACCSRDCP